MTDLTPDAISRNKKKEHFEAAVKYEPGSADASEFYIRYPSKSNQKKINLLRSEHFEDFVQYVGLAFDHNSDTSALTATTGGLFNWSNETVRGTDAMNVSSCKTLRERQLVLISYLFELIYDVYISPQTNVSRDPGFESCLGIYGSE